MLVRNLERQECLEFLKQIGFGRLGLVREQESALRCSHLFCIRTRTTFRVFNRRAKNRMDAGESACVHPGG
jgi:hypothetical protein